LLKKKAGKKRRGDEKEQDCGTSGDGNFIL